MYWIEGWIEVSLLPDVNAALAWAGVINLGSLIEVADDVSERLFMLRKLCVTGKKILAPNRGLPANPSGQVQDALARISEHERVYGKGEFGGYTYATWAEVRSYDIDDEIVRQSNWKLVFDLARQLEQRFEADRIRFVVWFNW